MASDGIACRILIQNKLLEQVDTFPYLGSLITEDEYTQRRNATIRAPVTFLGQGPSPLI